MRLARRGIYGRRGDSITNVVIIITLVVIAMLLSVWFVRMLRPTRHVIGAVTEDMDELNQHMTNACGFDNYLSPYAMQTIGGVLAVNETHYCVDTEVFGMCKLAPCPVQPINIALQGDVTPITIQRVERGQIVISKA